MQATGPLTPYNPPTGLSGSSTTGPIARPPQDTGQTPVTPVNEPVAVSIISLPANYNVHASEPVGVSFNVSLSDTQNESSGIPLPDPWAAETSTPTPDRPSTPQSSSLLRSEEGSRFSQRFHQLTTHRNLTTADVYELYDMAYRASSPEQKESMLFMLRPAIQTSLQNQGLALEHQILQAEDDGTVHSSERDAVMAEVGRFYELNQYIDANPELEVAPGQTPETSPMYQERQQDLMAIIPRIDAFTASKDDPNIRAYPEMPRTIDYDQGLITPPQLGEGADSSRYGRANNLNGGMSYSYASAESPAGERGDIQTFRVNVGGAVSRDNVTAQFNLEATQSWVSGAPTALTPLGLPGEGSQLSGSVGLNVGRMEFDATYSNQRLSLYSPVIPLGDSNFGVRVEAYRDQNGDRYRDPLSASSLPTAPSGLQAPDETGVLANLVWRGN